MITFTQYIKNPRWQSPPTVARMALKTGLLLSTVGISFFAALPCSSQTISPYAKTQHETMAIYTAKQAVPLDMDMHTVLVKFTEKSTTVARDNACRKVGFGAMQTYTIVPGLALIHVAGNPVDACKRLAKDPNVEYAEPNYTLYAQTIPDDKSFSFLWGMNDASNADIDAPEAWDLYRGDPNYRIAVIDSGIDLTHPDLQGNIWVNPGETPNDGIDNDGNGYIDDISGWDFTGTGVGTKFGTGDNNPQDGDGHGTHVSGTIAARGNNGIGVVGVVWSGKIVPLKFLSDIGSGSTANAILAVQYCVTNGIGISNNSWGGGGASTALRNAITSAGRADHLFVAAAGNDSLNIDGVLATYPASYNLVNQITVAATASTGALAPFSNYGNISVHVAAPGSGILSTWSTTVVGSTGYNTISGTSMATPHVTGIAALVRGKMPGWNVAQVKAAILGGIKTNSTLTGKTVTGGTVSAFKALSTTNTETVPPTVSATISKVPNVNGWINAAVTLALTATDGVGGSGVRDVRYVVGAVSTTVVGSTASVTYSTSGIRKVDYSASDNSGNFSSVSSISIKVDVTNPVTTNSVNSAGTLITLAASDSNSGVATTSYAIDDGPLSVYSTGIVLDGLVHTVTYFSTDLAGNVEATKSVLAPAGVLSTVSLNPATVVGGVASTGTVTLMSPAPVGGIVVTLSSNSTSAKVPATVTVLAAATTATFNVATLAVGANMLATISGVAGLVTKSASLTITQAPVTFSAFTLSPTAVIGGRTSTGTVTLNQVATTNTTVTLVSSNVNRARVPVSVVILAGQRSATFTVTTVATARIRTVTISAGALGTTRTVILTINP